MGPRPMLGTAALAASLTFLGLLSARADLQNAAFLSDASATYSAYGGTPEKAVNEIGSGADWWHSADDTVAPPWKTDLGAVVPVDSVMVRARDGYNDRIRDCSPTLYPTADAAGTTMYSNVIKLLSGVDQTLRIPDGTYARSALINYAGTKTVNLSEVYVYSENLACGKSASMSVYWGTTDGGTNWAQWEATNTLGVSGLTVDTTYYFRFRAANAVGTGHSAASGAFRTVPVSDGLAAWYGASSLELGDGGAVGAWGDSSPELHYDLAQGSAGAQPTFYTNTFNGNTYFDFGKISANGRLQWPNNNVTALNQRCLSSNSVG